MNFLKQSSVVPVVFLFYEYAAFERISRFISSIISGLFWIIRRELDRGRVNGLG